MAKEKETVSKDTFDRAQYIDEMRRLVYENMRKAEETKNWLLFDHYADMYIKLSR